MDSELFLGPIGFGQPPFIVTVFADANEIADGPFKRMAASELDRGAGVGTSGITSSSYGNRKLEAGEDMISLGLEIETSTHEMDLGILGISADECGLDFRRLVEILRQSLPSDKERDGLNTFVSGSMGSGSAISMLSRGSDNRGVGFGRALRGVGRGMFGELYKDSFDRNGPRAFEYACAASLLERCTPGRTCGRKMSVGSRWTIVAAAIEAVFATPISPIDPIL